MEECTGLFVEMLERLDMAQTNAKAEHLPMFMGVGSVRGTKKACEKRVRNVKVM